MPQYVEVKGQTIEFPDGMPMADIEAAVKKNMLSIKSTEPSTMDNIKQGAGNVLAGLTRGAGSIGATLLAPKDMLMDAIDGKGLSLASNRQRRADMDSALGSMGAETDSWMYKGGKLAGEIAGTAGAGGAVANVIGQVAPRVAVAAPGLLEAIRTGGMSANGAGMATRAAGGAISGAASAGMVGDDVAMGAAIGGALPPALKGAGLVGAAAGRRIMSMLTPQQQSMAAEIAKMTGRPLDEVLQAVQKQGPSILNIKPTVPQILQDDAISQLQRSAINAGDKSIMVREAAQNADRLAGFGRVAPVFGTVNEAADNAGNMIGKFGQNARAEESKRVSRLFDSVDPFGDTAIELPINAMRAVRGKYLGEGTFGTGGSSTAALKAAEDVGTTILPAVKETTQKQAGKTQSLEQAVRSAGGIRGGSGELKDLGIKQSGTTGLVNNRTGKAADLLAEDMYQRGFIPDNDPATLFDMLRNGKGRKVFASDATEGGMQRSFEQSMGDAPEATHIMRPVPFETVQNFRSSLNEAWKDASMTGKNQEAASLKGMISAIDSKVKTVADGGGNPGEAFPSDIVQTWKEAIKAHADKKARFDTGPQARMFRKGRDGQQLIQGAEIPREFFNPRASQIEDAQAFQKLTQSNSDLSQALKSYAMTDASQQVTKDGMLSASKLPGWVNGRSGALKETMSEQDMALLNEIVSGVKAADKAATGGMAKGSNSIQNAEAAGRLMGNGLLDSKMTNLLLNRTPVIGSFTGPMLESLRKTAQATKAEKLGGLLSDPDVFATELKKYLARQQPGKLSGLLSDPRLDFIGQAGYRAAPVLMGD